MKTFRKPEDCYTESYRRPPAEKPLKNPKDPKPILPFCAPMLVPRAAPLDPIEQRKQYVVARYPSKLIQSVGMDKMLSLPILPGLLKKEWTKVPPITRMGDHDYWETDEGRDFTCQPITVDQLQNNKVVLTTTLSGAPAISYVLSDNTTVVTLFQESVEWLYFSSKGTLYDVDLTNIEFYARDILDALKPPNAPLPSKVSVQSP